MTITIKVPPHNPNTPQFVRDIKDQLGGPLGAIGYCGGRNQKYADHKFEHVAHGKPHNGLFWFTPNTNYPTTILIAVNLNDTYTVTLFRYRRTTHEVVIIETESEVYCDNLQEIVEDMYDKYIRKNQNGFIKI